MSKIYDKYLELKKENNNKVYLFKSGFFYIFIDDDAAKINETLGLKLSKLNETISKCGFPNTHLDKYISLLQSNNIDFQIINDIDRSNLVYKREDVDPILKKIYRLDVNYLSANNCQSFITELKEDIRKIAKFDL